MRFRSRHRPLHFRQIATTPASSFNRQEMCYFDPTKSLSNVSVSLLTSLPVFAILFCLSFCQFDLSYLSVSLNVFDNTCLSFFLPFLSLFRHVPITLLLSLPTICISVFFSMPKQPVAPYVFVSCGMHDKAFL